MEITAVENTFRIRRETQEDYRRVEELTRRAFWNLYVPGCSEHYLAHILRDHADFIPELDLVAELEGSIIGNIMYTKASLTDEDGTEKPILTFGPISVLPEYQRQGCGKALIEASFRKAAELGYDVVVKMCIRDSSYLAFPPLPRKPAAVYLCCTCPEVAFGCR